MLFWFSKTNSRGLKLLLTSRLGASYSQQRIKLLLTESSKHQESGNASFSSPNLQSQASKNPMCLSFEVMVCVRYDSLDPENVSSWITISRCLFKRQEQRVLTHQSSCPQGQLFLLQYWCPCYKDGDAKVDAWLVYSLI